MKSSTLPLYRSWLETASQLDVTRVDDIYYECEQHYDVGGDIVVECMEPSEILSHFFVEGRDWGQVLASVRDFCNAHTDAAKDCRWGEDSDPELQKQHWT